MDRDFSWYVSKIYDWLKEKAGEIVSYFRSKVDYVLNEARYYYRLVKKKILSRWENQWKPVIDYSLTFIPYIVVYGLLLNFVTYSFFDYAFGVFNVVSHGLAWYFVKEEVFGEMIPQLRPTVSADVKVKDR